MHCTRRAVLAATALAPALAHAQTPPPAPEWLRQHPAFGEWERPARPADRLMNTRVEPAPGAERVTVREWLGGRPTVLAVWATWCPPCLVEKAPEARFGTQLEAAGSRAQIKALLAYDRARSAEARTRLAQLGAAALDSARATDSAEQSLLWILGSTVTAAQCTAPRMCMRNSRRRCRSHCCLMAMARCWAA